MYKSNALKPNTKRWLPYSGKLPTPGWIAHVMMAALAFECCS